MNRKIFYLVLVLPAVFLSPVWAQCPGKSAEEDSLYEFLQGTYHLIGRLPDSSTTYTGKVTFTKTDNGLQVRRTIDGKAIEGAGKIETATADKIKVLRVRFINQNKSYELTYLINSDLDNHARLSGYLYLIPGGTKVPGLEALFIDPQAFK
ncbi:MAG: hypothetical protein OS130_04415 [Thermodesulfobacteriota bacterium]|jgi:hypothetical protein|nr:MAG: hypothetical protein OS130_04415 [Thermodesulfobacteriota bacterium]